MEVENSPWVALFLFAGLGALVGSALVVVRRRRDQH
ncbi:LPXTG cell wall anchor domain-containing protein [Williamsia sp. M5A3_1d]